MKTKIYIQSGRRRRMIFFSVCCCSITSCFLTNETNNNLYAPLDSFKNKLYVLRSIFFFYKLLLLLWNQAPTFFECGRKKCLYMIWDGLCVCVSVYLVYLINIIMNLGFIEVIFKELWSTSFKLFDLSRWICKRKNFKFFGTF